MPSTRLLYGTTAFLSAFLLFVIEPMAAKQMLPSLGGSSAVWLTCLVFFQVTLLLGYLYAHWLTTDWRANDIPWQRRTYTAVLTVAAVALALSLVFVSGTANASHPVATIFWTLTRSIGLPFLVLAATSPLLQRWLSQREADPAGEPAPVWFRLFALSNAGSLLALLAYPTLIEPHLALRTQRILWAIGFLIFTALAYAIASRSKTVTNTSEMSHQPKSEPSTASGYLPLSSRPKSPQSGDAAEQPALSASRTGSASLPLSSNERAVSFRMERPERAASQSNGRAAEEPSYFVLNGDTNPLPATGVPPDGRSESSPQENLHRWLWFLLPMAAAMQLSAVTAHLTINIAAIPLLWVLPLAVYLLTFILAFDKPVLYQRPLVVRLLVLMLASLGYALSKDDFSLPIGLTIAFFLFECFVACLFCHGETYRLRPQRASEATLFYLLIAAGGATGTFLVGIAFPLLFSANYDLALAFFATAVLALAATWHDGWAQRLLWTTASILLLSLAVMLHLGYRRQTVASVRNFYGSLRVKQADFHQQHVPYRTLMHGTIQHGTQIFSPDGSHIPTTYYARDSGIGLALRFCCDTLGANGLPRPRHIGVIGLGTGTVAAYGRPGDRIRFYEINPQVEPIARNLFTYLRDSPAAITVVPGDARTSLTHEPPQRFDVLILDAFSGDAIPLHLLTAEAMRLYVSHLTPTGILVVHVSNQYLNLAPEIALLGASANLEVRDVNSPANDERGEYRAEWVVMTGDPTFFSRPEVSPFPEPILPTPGLRLWTDDYSSLLPLIRLTSR